MNDSLYEKLKSETLFGLWLDLKEHVDRNVVFHVSQELDLVLVGVALATDDVQLVTGWLLSGEITRPTLPQIKSWSESDGKMFRFLILQPHIMIQELAH